LKRGVNLDYFVTISFCVSMLVRVALLGILLSAVAEDPQQHKSELNTTRSMTHCKQQCHNWCWATSAVMAASYFGGGTDCNTLEKKVAGHELKTNCNVPNPCDVCDQTAGPSNVADGIKFLSGHSYQTSGSTLSQQDLDSALKQGPVVLEIKFTSHGHLVVIESGSNGNYHGYDPEGSSINSNYAGLTSYDGGTWHRTVHRPYSSSGASSITENTMQIFLERIAQETEEAAETALAVKRVDKIVV
jgi:hypothetical protein